MGSRGAEPQAAKEGPHPHTSWVPVLLALLRLCTQAFPLPSLCHRLPGACLFLHPDRARFLSPAHLFTTRARCVMPSLAWLSAGSLLPGFLFTLPSPCYALRPSSFPKLQVLGRQVGRGRGSTEARPVSSFCPLGSVVLQTRKTVLPPWCLPPPKPPPIPTQSCTRSVHDLDAACITIPSPPHGRDG